MRRGGAARKRSRHRNFISDRLAITHASQMVAAGVHPKVASERLGHSTISITLDLCSHVMPGMQADAAEQVDAALQAAIEGTRKAK